jgi:hypothetical protein
LDRGTTPERPVEFAAASRAQRAGRPARDCQGTASASVRSTNARTSTTLFFEPHLQIRQSVRRQALNEGEGFNRPREA